MPISYPPLDEDEVLIDANGESLSDNNGNIILR